MMLILITTLLVYMQPVLAQIVLSPVFDQSVYSGTEGGTIRVCLSLPALTQPQFSSLPCSFDVEVRAGPLPRSDPRNSCDFGTDYTLSSGSDRSTVTFTPGSADSTCFNISLLTDGIVEGDEYFTLDIVGSSITPPLCASGFTISQDASDEVLVRDSPDDVVCVSFDIKSALVIEGINRTIVLRSSIVEGRFQRAVQIGVVCSRTTAVGVIPALRGADFTYPAPFTFRFTRGSSTSTPLVINIVDDAIAEPRESFICTLQSGTTQAVRSKSPEQVTVDIIDDDELIIRWARDFYSFSESVLRAPVELVTSTSFGIRITVIGEPIQITSGIVTQELPTTTIIPGLNIRLSEQYSTIVFRGITYAVATVGLSTGDVDQTRNAFIFYPGNTSSLERFTHRDDSVCEYDQLYMATFEFGADVVAAGFKTRKGEPSVTYVAIEDDDRTEISFSRASYTVDEDEGYIEVTVTSTGAFFAPLTVTVTCSPDTASATDFSAGVFTTTFFVNRRASSLTSRPIRINITNDNLAESEECFVCEITDVDGPPCAVIGSSAETRICIQDSRACPSGQRLQSHNGATCEDPDGEGPTVVGCHFDCPAGQLYSTTFKNCYRPENCPRCKAHASGDPHYTTFDGVYYTIFPQCSHIAAQDCLGGSWSVAHVTSNRCSGGRAPTCIDESILIVPRLGTRLHYRSVNNSYWFVGNVPSSDELAVTLSGTYFTAHLREEDVTVLHQGTWLEVSTSVRWAGKMCGLFGTCDCNTTNEFVLRNGTVLTDFNDPRFLPEYNADEETGVCRVRPPPLPRGPTCVAPQPDAEAFCNVLRNTSGPYAACHSRYPPGNTYQLPVNSPFDQCVFDYCAIGQSSACADILAYAGRCRGDGIAVGDPPAVCRTTCPSGLEFNSCGPLVPPSCDLPAGVSGCREGCICPRGSLLSRDGICVTPSSDVEIFFDASSASVTEGGSVMACSIRLSSCYPSDIPVSIRLMPASEVPRCQRATAGQDFGSGIFPRDIIIPANTVEFKFNINILDDEIFELDEVFKLMLVYGGGQEGVSIRSSAATCRITITDNDDLEVCFQSDPPNYEVNEGDKVDIALKTNRQFSCPFSVMVGTSDGSAEAPGDYMSLMMTVNFDVRTQMAMTMVMSMTDNIVEDDEDLFLTITSERRRISVCDGDRAVIVIRDRTIVCGFEAPSVMVKEKAGFVTKHISCNRPAPSDFTLLVRTVPETAQAGSDFVSGTSTLRFRTGSSRASFNVSIVDDCSDVMEPLETFRCELSVGSNPSSAGIALVTRTSTVTIMDDDVLVSFTDSEVMVTESAGFVDVSVSATGFTAGDGFSVTVNVVGGTAQAGVDYTGTQWTVDFPSGSESVTFRIPIICETERREDDETIDLQLSVPSAFQSCVCLDRIAMMRIDIIDNCGDTQIENMKVNDTVIADPVYTVPLYVRGGENSFTPGTPLCYEIHGQANRVFNLISDECTSVNAYYQSAHSPDAGNVITSIGIVATNGVVRTTVSVNVTSEGECSTVVNSGEPLSRGVFTRGVAEITVDPGCVMITVPNCGEDVENLMFWVRCRVRTLSFDHGRQSVDQEMIKFVVGRGLGLNEGSHGLIGQFWGIPININPYSGVWRGSFTPLSARWNITMMPTAPASPRSFAAILGSRTWTEDGRPVIPNSVCLYAGDSQGGPLGEARNFDFGPVVEGHYTEYICEGGIYDTTFTYSKYTGP